MLYYVYQYELPLSSNFEWFKLYRHLFKYFLLLFASDFFLLSTLRFLLLLLLLVFVQYIYILLHSASIYSLLELTVFTASLWIGRAVMNLIWNYRENKQKKEKKNTFVTYGTGFQHFQCGLDFIHSVYNIYTSVRVFK